jgi:hypothetical protein
MRHRPPVLDQPWLVGHDGLMSASQQGRWADLPAGERQRREAQSAAARARAAAGSSEVTTAERRRRAAQSRTDREDAAIQDAIHNTVYGGDINMMSKGDW